MSFNDGSRDGQAQPQAFPEALLALLHLMERMEDFFFVGIVDSRTGIGDSNQRKATGRIDRRHSSMRDLRHAGKLPHRPHVDTDEATLDGEP